MFLGPGSEQKFESSVHIHSRSYVNFKIFKLNI